MNEAVEAITGWKVVSTTAIEHFKPESHGIQHSEAPRSPREPEGQSATVDNPLAILPSAIVPTGSIEVGLEDILEQSTQQNLPRRFAFKAPSSHGDLAAGFTFAKPKQPPMKFTRQIPAYEPGIQDPAHRTRDGNSPILSCEREPTVAGPTTTATCLTTNTSTNTVSSSDNATTEVNVTEPKTTITSSIQVGPASAISNTPPPEETDTAHVISQPSSLEIIDAQSPLLSPCDNELEETKNKFQPRSISILTEPFTPKQPDRHIGVPIPQSLNRPVTTPKAHVPKTASSPHVSRSKVTKSGQRKHSNTTPRPRIDLEDLTSKSSVTEEDLLQILLARYSQDKQEKEQVRIKHATDVRELEEICHSLWDRLEESKRRVFDQESELSKHRTRQPKFANQIKKLQDYVKGLTNDQHGLRDRFMSMQRMHSAAHESKQQIDVSLQESRSTASDIDKKVANALKDAGHEMENLARVVQDQKAQLQKDAELLQHERERSQRLELEVSKINTSQQNSMHIFAQHANCVVQKMNNMLEKPEELQSVRRQESLDMVSATLGQCLGSLDKLHEGQEVKMKHLSGLDGSMRDLANGYVIASPVEPNILIRHLVLRVDCKLTIMMYSLAERITKMLFRS